MRFSGWAALAAVCLAAPASAFTGYQYTFKGSLNLYDGFGDNQAAMSATLGHPTTFELTFNIPTLSPAGHPSFDPVSSYFAQASATLKLDGVTRVTSGLNPSGINLIVTSQVQSLSFGMGAQADFVPAIPGVENWGVHVSLNFPLNTFSQDQLPSGGDILALATGGFVSITLSNLPAGSQFASLAEATSTLQMNPVTSVTVTPVPEPGEWAMIACGLSVVGAAARRRRKG